MPTRSALPEAGLLRTARRLARLIPFHRVFHSVELSILVLLAAVVDLFVGGAGHPGAARRARRRGMPDGGRSPDRRAGLLAAAVTEASAPQLRGRRADHGQTAGRS